MAINASLQLHEVEDCNAGRKNMHVWSGKIQLMNVWKTEVVEITSSIVNVQLSGCGGCSH